MNKNTLPSVRTTALGLLLVANIAIASPVVCSPGYWDATCNGRVNTGYQTAPICPTGAGWTTVVPAKWIGSKFSAPECTHQDAPVCPTGYTQTTAPTWNGSSWVGQTCAAPIKVPTQPTLPEVAAICGPAVSAYVRSTPIGYFVGQWDSFNGPFSDANYYIPATRYGGYNGIGATVDKTYTGALDLYWASDLGNPAGGGTLSGGIAICQFAAGTNHLVAVGYDYQVSYDGG